MLTEHALNLMADALSGAVTELSLHAADPGATGANETTAARQVPTFTPATGGDFDLDGSAAFTGGTASGDCTHVGMWAGANFLGGFALTGDQAFNAAGEYTVNTLNIDGTAT